MEVRFPEHDRPPAWKVAFFQYAIALTFVGLLVGYWRIQIGKHHFYLDQAEHNRIRSLPIIVPAVGFWTAKGEFWQTTFPLSACC